MRTWEPPSRRRAGEELELELVVEIGVDEIGDVEADLEADRSWNRFLCFVAGLVAVGIVALVLVVTLGGIDSPETVREITPCVADMTDSWIDPAC